MIGDYYGRDGDYELHYKGPGARSIAGGIQKLSTKATPSESQLGQQVLQKRKILPTQPKYLFDTNTVSSAISTVWSKTSAKARGVGDIQAQYDEAYLAASEYITLADMELSYASRLLKNGDETAAKKHIASHDHLIKMHQLASDTALSIYSNDIESAKILAKGLYEGSKEAFDFGSKFAGFGPAQALAIDTGLLSVDFAVDFNEQGIDEATKKLVKNLIMQKVISGIKVEKDTTKFIGRSGLYNQLRKVSTDPAVKKQLMTFISKSTAHGVTKLGSAYVDSIEKKLGEYYGQKATSTREP